MPSYVPVLQLWLCHSGRRREGKREKREGFFAGQAAAGGGQSAPAACGSPAKGGSLKCGAEEGDNTPVRK